ncbi:MAG: hypothetical protein ACRCW9_05930 [Cetobacterium sp.]
MFKYLVYEDKYYFQLVETQKSCSHCLYNQISLRNCIEFDTYINDEQVYGECHLLTHYEFLDEYIGKRDLLEMKILGLGVLSFKERIDLVEVSTE